MNIKPLIGVLMLAGTAFAPAAMADTVRTAEGASCSFDADDSPFEVETYVEQGDNNTHNNHPDYNTYYDGDDQRIGMKLTVKFGGPTRLDCDKMYQLELRSKQAQVEELEAKVKLLSAAKDIQW